MRLRKLLQKVVYKEKSSSASYISYLRKKGMQIGEDVTIYVPQKTTIDEQYPWMIEIGDHVRITKGVIILTHDYSWYVIKGCTGAVYGSSGKVKIGNNVFIGMNAIITRNVTIGNNVIIGAGSVVTKDCLDNGVYAGCPAKRIMSLEEFMQKRKELQAVEAKELALQYYKAFQKKPEKKIFSEYFMLFSSENTENEQMEFIQKMSKHGNLEQSEAYISQNKPPFADFKEFLEYCFDDIVSDYAGKE